ncbi:MAG: ArnT family glycosyltransferase, partial [Candidatus Omnitrophota bacterium]
MFKKHWLWIFVGAAGAIYLAWTARYSVMSDEIEHLHAAYLVSRGLLPFRDFWEHHSPLLWISLSPFIRLLPETGGILIAARVACFLFSGALLYLVWSISKLLWRQEAHFGATALFFFSGGVLAQYSFMRPDPFMLFFAFSSFYLLIRALQEGKDRFFLYSGFCMSLAFCLSPKWITALFVIPVALFLCRPSWRRWFEGNFLYGAGFALGAAPLAAYLFGNGIWQEFYLWVFKFNVKEIVFMGFFHPTILALLAAGIVGAAAAWRRLGTVRPLWMALWALVLFNTFFIYKIDIKHTYYGASFLLFSCTLASGFLVLVKSLKGGVFRAALWAVLI